MPNLNTPTGYDGQPLPPLQRLADARRILEINLDSNPLADASVRHELRQAKRAAWLVLANVCEELVATLDTAAGDPDLEDATGLEDGFEEHEERFGYAGPGCDVADVGEDNGDREQVDEREAEEDV